MGALALIGLGSNLGDRKAHLDAAVAALAETPGFAVRAVSSYHETAPVGGPGGQRAFLNAAARLETASGPFELLRALQGIEQTAGRVRTVRWGERTLDLDLLIYEAKVIETAELTVPHPRLGIRRFVLAPLVEIAPNVADLWSGTMIHDLLANLDRRPRHLALDGATGPFKAAVFRRIVASLRATGLVWSSGESGPVEIVPTTPGPGEIDEDRWLVSDVLVGSPESMSLHPEARGDRFLRPQPNVPSPTFLVALKGGWLEDSKRRSGRRPRRCGQVVLWPESDDSESITSEIETACAGIGGAGEFAPVVNRRARSL